MHRIGIQTFFCAYFLQISRIFRKLGMPNICRVLPSHELMPLCGKNALMVHKTWIAAEWHQLINMRHSAGKTQFENTRTTRRNAKKKFQIRVHLSAGVSWAPRADIARGATGSEGKPNTCLDEHPSVLLLPAGADPQSTWLRTERIYNITEWDESPGEGTNTPLGPPMFSMNPQSSGLVQWWAPLEKKTASEDHG